MDGVDDLGAVDALQIDRRDPEVGMSELALYHDQRDALAAMHIRMRPHPQLASTGEAGAACHRRSAMQSAR